MKLRAVTKQPTPLPTPKKRSFSWGKLIYSSILILLVLAGADKLHRIYSQVEAVGILYGAEVSIEVDPRVTAPEQLRHLREIGFNRLSMGVQDLTPSVQTAIGRNQTIAETIGVTEAEAEILRNIDQAKIATITQLLNITREKAVEIIRENS